MSILHIIKLTYAACGATEFRKYNKSHVEAPHLHLSHN